MQVAKYMPQGMGYLSIGYPTPEILFTFKLKHKLEMHKGIKIQEDPIWNPLERQLGFSP